MSIPYAEGMNKTTKMLKRWLKLDEALSRGWMSLKDFAKRNGVSEKTVRRDIDAFRRLGQGIYWWAPDGKAAWFY